MSKIEWTDRTWNPITGCSKVSPGCENCYALRMSHRLASNPKTGIKYQNATVKSENGQVNWTGSIHMDRDALTIPSKRKKPTIYFVGSMTDIFHEMVTDQQLWSLFTIMRNNPQHIFQVLTKRADRMLDFFQQNAEYHNFAKTHPNVWIGVSVENQKYANHRIPRLLKVPAAVRFVSCEPLLGPLYLDMVDENKCFWLPDPEMPGTSPHLDWVIAGGESGPGARPMHPDWVRSLRDQCAASGVPFLFKQWGEYEHDILPFRSYQHWIDKAQTWLQGWRRDKDACIDAKGAICRIGRDFKSAVYPVWPMRKVGKHLSGNTLDGRQHLAYPPSLLSPSKHTTP